MAFEINHFDNTSSGAAYGPRVWTYISETDTTAQVAAEGYFDEISGTLNLGDLIYIVASDGLQKRIVLSERYTAPVETGGYVFGGLVNTSDIANDAITADKLAASVAGDGIAGGAGSPLSVNVDDVGVEIDTNTLGLKDLGVTNSKLALNVPKTVAVDVSSADWIAMNATPKLLVAAPGANKMHRVLSVRYEVDYNSVQYTLGGNVAVQYDSTPSGGGTLASATVANTVFNGYSADSTVGASGALPSGPSASVVNKGLYLSTPTAFATGNSPVRVYVTYETVSTVV